MKTLSVEIERRQTLEFVVSVPDHWFRGAARKAMTPPIIEEIAGKADSFDWDNGDGFFSIAAVRETTDAAFDQIDYAFPDEPAPPHPDQLPLTALELPA